MPRYLDPKILLSEESDYTTAELEAYDKYWDAVSTEKTLISGHYKLGLEEGEQIGYEKGAQVGFEKGAEQERIILAKKLIATGMSIVEVAQLIQLPLETLQKII